MCTGGCYSVHSIVEPLKRSASSLDPQATTPRSCVPQASCTEQGALFCWTRKQHDKLPQHRARGHTGDHLRRPVGKTFLITLSVNVHGKRSSLQRDPSQSDFSSKGFTCRSLTMSKSSLVLRKNKTTYGKKLKVKLHKALKKFGIQIAFFN